MSIKKTVWESSGNTSIELDIGIVEDLLRNDRVKVNAAGQLQFTDLCDIHSWRGELASHGRAFWK